MVFDSFSKRGSALYEADRRGGGGGEPYSEPENGVPYHVCLVSIARSPMELTFPPEGGL